MRAWKWKKTGILLLAVFSLAAGSRTALAAEEEYTYTVRLYAGNQGELTEGGIDVVSETAWIDYDRDCTTISGLKYGDTVYIRPQEAAVSTDARYYVRGVRRSGRDNSEAEAPAFSVACDRDFVAAYSVSGDLAAYRVNYLDMDGNEIMASDTYYGNIGDRQYVSSRYIEGYRPQALNLVKTLSANEAENVFDFRYAPVGTPSTAPAGPAADAGAEGGAAVPPADAGTEIPEDEVPLGGDAGVNNPGGETPGTPQDIVDLDDADVPLANIVTEKPGIRLGYLPVYLGIAAAALIVLAGAAIYLKKRMGKVLLKEAEKTEEGISGRKKLP